ncbi:MAG: bifunctional phosphoribosylaminoimidazolecarboxamide formyltransferase/IMP cyclohydrolase [Candidatus Eremiobacteraeota bacterium]|nr:bifunctional phosphoribosylaminoimidazolecarboxamide formyltransferase/IMP cyclohydrolase [Candidatus Eremiobacteraeota bacterium]MBV9055689.1 bifunctional phosphoribosylaminoimidazolecarboxamide formyltransferase/IMP cyclohydrolase [Candidatus Eremiobacteraeota bacterium]MBV9698923.1 bifunctional phosphoribosylaminoimidazolecarboxamide formyltransferase/IMP cyclohydrolase [Candidatus Eremiobacteraeota bacterium]
MPESSPSRAALFSLYDKTGAGELAAALDARGIAIFATGGTRDFLAARGVRARDVGDLTGFAPLFGERVKTLHPSIFGGILYDRGSAQQRDEAHRRGIPEIVAVVVNLYPFEATVARPGVTINEAIEQIDIGGVALVRAAAKNFASVSVLTHPAQYQESLAALEGGESAHSLRRKFAVAAFERTAEYDAAISHYLATAGEVLPTELPGALALTLPLVKRLRYGTNPQERAAFYLARPDRLPEQLGGKALSYNNLLDLDAALRLLARAQAGASFPSARESVVRAATIKHAVPCGVAQRRDTGAAVRESLAADSVSAFGGIVAVDALVDADAALEFREYFLEIVAAPEFEPEALETLRKKKNLRIMRFAPSLPYELARELRLRSALGGVLAEDDDPSAPAERWQVVSRRSPTDAEWQDLAFAWDVVRHVKSNGIVIVREQTTRGICAGQTNRVSAVQIAVARAGAAVRGSSCASDGFFPFTDGIEAAIEGGCSAIIAPGGSIRDNEVIAAADRRNAALVFSSHRYFLH